jgi:hypothetical protein
MFSLLDPDGNVVSVETREEANRLLSQGYSFQVAQEDHRGLATVRQGRAEDLAPGAIDATAGTRLLADTGLQEQADTLQHNEEVTREANTFGEQALATASRAASGATFGLTGALGLTNTAGLSEQDRGVLRENTQEAELLGDVVGAVSPVGAEAMAVRAAGRLVRGSGWGATMGRMAFEGAAGGAINSASEAASEQDVSVFAERLAGDASIGGLFGAGLGVPFGLARGATRAMRGLSRRNPLARAVDDMAEPALREGELLGDRLTPRSTGVIDDISGSRGGIDHRDPLVRRAVAESDAFGRMTPDEMLSEVQQASHVVRSADELSQSLSRVTDDISFRGADIDGLPRLSQELTGPLRAGLDALDLGAGSAAGTLRRRISSTLEGSFEGLTPQAAADRLLRMRNEVDEAVTAAGGLGAEGLQRISADIQEVQQRLGEALGDSTIFGEGAQALTSRTSILDQFKKMNREVLSSFRSKAGLGAGESLSGLSEAQMVKAIRTMADRGGDVTVFRTLRDMAELVESAGHAVPDFVPRGIDSQRLGRFLDRASARAADMRNRAGDAMNQEVFQANRQVLGGVGMTAGLILGGGPGAAIAGVSGVMGMFRSPAARTRLIASLKNAMSSQGRRMATATQKTRSVLRSRNISPFVSRMNVRGGSIAALAVHGSEKDQREAYTAMAQQVELLSANPALLAQAGEGTLPGVEVVDPRLSTAMGMQTYRQMSILASALPRGRANMGLRSQIYAPRPPARSEVQEFLEVAAVVEDPIFSLELLSAGRLQQRTARAVQQAFPQFHAEMSAQILRDLAEARIREEPVNYQASLQLSTFLGTPLDPTMEPGFNSLVTSQSAQTSAQEQAQTSMPISTRRPDLIQNEASPVERLMT